MSELITLDEKTKGICEFLKTLPDKNEIKLGNQKLSSEQAIKLRNYRNNIPDIMANKVWVNMKMNYAFAHREGDWQQLVKDESGKELMKFKAYGLANQLWEVPLKAIDAVFAQSRKFTEFPSVTSLLKSWNAIKGDYSETEKETIRAYLTKSDDLYNRPNTKNEMYDYFREIGLIKEKNANSTTE